MKFIDMSDADKRMYVVRLLNINPYTPEEWPTDLIERFLVVAERAAREAMGDAARELMSPN